MRNLRYNMQPIWYSLLTGKTENVDEYGNDTGTYTLTYATPVKKWMSVRWNIGDVMLNPFGLNEDGRRRLATDDLNCPINVGTILWIGITPDSNGESGEVKHNYELSGSPERSLNQIVYLVQEVHASDGAEPAEVVR